MSLFQKSVEKKYLNEINSAVIDEKFVLFQNYFGNPEIQENIRNAKEEQFQEGFLRELFVAVLGYTLNPEPNFNLTTELKNISNSKKADGAILKAGNALAVIELKSTNTTDLDKIETQAFGYKNHHPKCVYVITSNFEKLRFYIQNAVDYIDFNLFELTRKQFELMWLCLAKENLLNNIPQKIKNASVLQEENISKKLYADYSKFRTAIYNNLVKNNTGIDKLLLFKKTQKLLDRFLFIFFAEDRLLVPPNSINQIIEKWKDDVAFGDTKPLYETFKSYFRVLNTGRPKRGAREEIFAYNGGLFLSDEVLDQIAIDDELLATHTLKLSEYDFETDIDVNILGHIFEHSLGEIESVQAEIATTGVHAPVSEQPAVSKRKKDGIFYTPKYITKYIVENTVGKLCDEKRTELQIIDEEYAKGRKRRKKDIVRTLNKKLDDYRNWLLNLSILDPACGSGAFLNQALEFLIAEHKKIDELRAQLLGGAIVFSDITTDILEKNIFGVDLNEESVEIAKLSLWLRTAQKGRKLNTLSNNIKCGNSLIDDPEVAGDKAFNWQNEFPRVFKKKKKQAWHITTATHNSRYSQRMFDNFVKKGEAVWLSEREEIIVSQTIAEIARKDELNIIEYNICGDHAHLILVCTEEELPKIIQKIKSMSARACNIEMGRTISLVPNGEHAPHARTDMSAATSEHAPMSVTISSVENREHAPEKETRGKTQYHLWTQKFGQNEITSNEQFENTIAYIQNNRNKHQLPENKELQSLAKEITCTRQHAFRTEYSGGFDVVIGNPPYVHLEKIKDTSVALKNANYETYHGQGDIYCVFVEKGIDVLKTNGLISYIMPNKWLQAGYGKPLREFFLKYKMLELIDFGDIQIFDGATTYPCIFISQKAIPQKEISISVLKESNAMDFKFNVTEISEQFETSSFSGETWVITSKMEQAFLERLQKSNKRLFEIIGDEAYYGIKTGLTEAFIINEETRNSIILKDSNASEIIKPVLRGRDIIPWLGTSEDCYLIGTFPALNIEIESYPSVKDYLLTFGKERLEQSGNKGSRKKTGNKWFETQDAIGYYQEFAKPKIMYQTFQVKPCFIYDEQGLFCNNSMWFIPIENKALLGVLNSKMGWWLITKYCTQIQNGCQLIWKYFGQIPIPKLNSTELTSLVETMLLLTKNQQEIIANFLKYLRSQFSLNKLSRKLESWYELEFSDFIKELNKAIKKAGGEKLSKMDEMEWMEVFENKKAKAQILKAEITKTDCEIDRLVYELYGLSKEEIVIVEGE